MAQEAETKQTSFKYVPFLNDENLVEVSYKVGISIAALNKLKANSRPSYATLKKLYDAGYDIIQSFASQEL